MKVLVIGSGGREHAIIDKLSESSLVTKIYAAPGNDGFDNCELVNIKVDDIDSLLKFALDKKIDLTVVGPEASLAAGVVDLFLKNNLKIFGPTKAASQIECSKDFAKNLMKKYNIPTASFATFTSFELAKEYLDKHGVPIVVKYDGLAQGKGVVVAKTYVEAIDALKDMLIDDKFGQAKVVLEDYLEGPEFSFMCFLGVNWLRIRLIKVQIVHPRLKQGGQYFVLFHEERGLCHDDELHFFSMFSSAKVQQKSEMCIGNCIKNVTVPQFSYLFSLFVVTTVTM